MAEEVTKLVKIGLDQSIINASIASADKLTAQIKALKDAQKESGVQDAETTGKIKALTLERNRNIEVVKQANLLASETTRGQEDLKAQLSILTAQYNKLTTEEQLNSEIGKKWGKTIKGISDELEANEKAVGNARRGVGKYEESFRNVLNTIGGGGGALRGFASGVEGVANGFKAAGGGVKGFGAALMSLGLPLIIAGVTALVGVLKTFKPIADAVESSVVALKAAFGALISGGSITEAVKQSQALLTVMRDLEDTQKAFAISAQKYNNEIAKLIVSSKDRTKTDEERLAIVAKANKLEEEYFNVSVARLNKELAARQSAFISKNKISKAELQLLAEGTSKQSLELRERLEKGAQYSEDELAQIQDLLAERSKLDGESLVLKEKLANRTNQLQEEMEKEQQANADKEKARIEKINEVRKKAAEAEIQRQTELRAQFEAAEIANETIAKEFSQRNYTAEYQAYLASLDLIEKKRLDYITAGRDAVEVAKWVETEKQKAEEKAAKDTQMRLDAIAAEAFTNQIDLLNGQEALDVQAAELSIDNEAELQNKKYQIALDYAQKRLAIMRESALLDDVLTEKEIQNLQAVENTIKGLQQTITEGANQEQSIAQSLGLSDDDLEKMQLGLSTISGALQAVQSAIAANAENRIIEIDNQSKAEVAAVENSTLAETDKAAKKKAIEKKAAQEKFKIELAQFKVSKALSVALAVANTATAVMAQLSNPTPYVGFVLAALAAATGAVNIGIAASTKPPAPPGFKLGGYASGAGTGTSDSIPARLSNGESVNNAKTTAMFAPLLSAMNAAGGGVDWYRGEGFSQGGLVRKFAAGGLATNSGSMLQAQEATNIISANFAKSQPVLVLEQFQEVQGRQVRTEQNLQV